MKALQLMALGLIVAAGGCSSSQKSTDNTTFTKTETGVSVQVLLDEYKIHMPTVIPGGLVTFEVENKGSHTHNIEVNGQGVDAKLLHDLAPGDSASLRIKLAPGKYKVYCPVGPHATMGMRARAHRHREVAVNPRSPYAR